VCVCVCVCVCVKENVERERERERGGKRKREWTAMCVPLLWFVSTAPAPTAPVVFAYYNALSIISSSFPFPPLRLPNRF
jgi:hypothetical protein